MNRKNISRILVVSLVLSLSIPSYATASNVTISINQEGTSIQEIQDNLRENPLIPKLNMKLFDVMASYYELIEKYNLANTESDKKAVLDELTVIVDAVHEVIPNLTLNEYENTLNGNNPEGATLADLLDFFGKESTQLFYTKGNSRFVDGVLYEPELKLDANTVYEYNTKLLYIKTIYTNASKEEREDIQDTLTLFKSTLNGYENTETVLATLNSVFSGVETETPKEEQTAVSSFSDVPTSHWGHKDIMAMTNKGLFSGTKAPVNGVGTFAPSKTMSRAEFVTVVMRALYNDELSKMPSSGGQWWGNSYDLALDKGILKSNELDQGDLTKSMSRQEMALVLVRAAEQLGQSPSQLVSTSKIADYNTVGTYYRDSVVKAYSMGMITGMGNGTFSPQGTMNRAQGAAVLNRLVDSSSRAKVDFSVPAPVETQGTIQQSDAYRRTALAGDTFVKSDGTKVVLKVDQASGVLGYGQGVATDLGRIIAGQNNQTVKHGFQISGTECDTPYHRNNLHPNGGASYRGQKYLVNPYNNEGHWDGDWGLIANAYQPSSSNPGSFDGQLSKDKNFFWDDLGGSWQLVCTNIEFVQSVNPTGK